jgi:hypothetical protein
MKKHEVIQEWAKAQPIRWSTQKMIIQWFTKQIYIHIIYSKET